MYCNSCCTTIQKNDLIYCEQCNVPLHKSCSNGCTSCGKILCDVCSIENNYMCEECNIEKNPEATFNVIRRSHLEQYTQCPYQIYLQLVLNKEPPMSNYAQLGIIVHQIIDSISDYDLNLESATEVLVDSVVDWNKEHKDEYQYIHADLLQVGHTCLNNFYDIRECLPSEFTSEENMVFSLGDDIPKVSCTLDRVMIANGEIAIADWKTGKPMSGKKLVTDLQPPLYIYAVYQKYGKLPKSFALYYLQYNKIINYVLVDEENWLYEVKTSRSTYVLDVKRVLDQVKKILSQIKENKFPMASEANQWRCNTMCYFGTSGVCAGVHNAQWKQASALYEVEE